MKYKIKSAIKLKERDGKYGKMADYALALETPDGKEVTATLSQKVETTAPSGEIDGTIEETDFGPKFTKEKPAFNPTSGGGFRQSDPEVQSAIIRQNALTNAVTFCIAKGGKDLTPGNVIKLATAFALYTSGKGVVTHQQASPVEEVQEHPQDEQQASESTVVQAKIANDPKYQEEPVDLADLPF